MDIRYLCYNLLRSDYRRISEYAAKVEALYGVSKYSVYLDMLNCLFKYNTRFLDYFYFRFFDPQTQKERGLHTNVWDMYLFQKRYNKEEDRYIFRDKVAFRDVFRDYFNYSFVVFKNREDMFKVISFLENNHLRKFVAKEPLGAVGKGVRVLTVENRDNITYLKYSYRGTWIEGKMEEVLLSLYNEGFILYESFIEQHEVLNALNFNSINTIRIVSFVKDNGEVELWGALLRIGLYESIDNFDAGGLAARIDKNTGIVISSAKVKDPFDNAEYSFHPITHAAILGIQIPYWSEVISMVKRAALEVKAVRTVGWDIAITKNGPTFIEGNDNWDKTLFELISGEYIGNKIKSLLNTNI